MKTHDDLIAVANRNFVASYRKLIEHMPDAQTRQVGGAFAFVTGLPVALFNGCVVVKPTSPDELETALDWVSGHGLPHRVWIAEPVDRELGEIPVGRGFRREERLYPGMVLHPMVDPPGPSAGVAVDQVDAGSIEGFLAVAADAGFDPAVARSLFSASFAADPDVRLFLGRLDGVAVGTSVAIRSGDASGIYAVGTRPPARRRGVGTALTWAAVEAGRAWGCDTVILQASELGLPIYEAMGFRTVVEYSVFIRP